MTIDSLLELLDRLFMGQTLGASPSVPRHKVQADKCAQTHQCSQNGEKAGAAKTAVEAFGTT
jgi:hypothetical protein